MIIEAGKSKSYTEGQQAGHPGELMLHFQSKECQAGKPERANILVLVQKPTAGEFPLLRGGEVFLF